MDEKDGSNSLCGKRAESFQLCRKTTSNYSVISGLSALNLQSMPEPPLVEEAANITPLLRIKSFSPNTSFHITPQLSRAVGDGKKEPERLLAFSPTDIQSKLYSPTRIMRKNIRAKFIHENSGKSEKTDDSAPPLPPHQV
jgi:hypothetical protein